MLFWTSPNRRARHFLPAGRDLWTHTSGFLRIQLTPLTFLWIPTELSRNSILILTEFQLTFLWIPTELSQNSVWILTECQLSILWIWLNYHGIPFKFSQNSNRTHWSCLLTVWPSDKYFVKHRATMCADVYIGHNYLWFISLCYLPWCYYNMMTYWQHIMGKTHLGKKSCGCSLTMFLVGFIGLFDPWPRIWYRSAETGLCK